MYPHPASHDYQSKYYYSLNETPANNYEHYNFACPPSRLFSILLFSHHIFLPFIFGIYLSLYLDFASELGVLLALRLQYQSKSD